MRQQGVEQGTSGPGIRARFAEMQEEFARTFPALLSDPMASQAVIVNPSLTLDQDVMARVAGAHHYEERMLCLLLLLRHPRTHVIYLSSTPISDTIIDYYIHLLPGIPALHARRRLHLICCHDASREPLTAKVLARPRVIRRIAEAIPDLSKAHMTCFNVTGLERDLSIRLGVPIYGCDPELASWGSKSGSRRIFREAGIPLPEGFEGLRDATDAIEAFIQLRTIRPDLRRAVVKLEEGFSGEGNAVLDFSGAPERGRDLEHWVRAQMPQLAFEAKDMTWDLYERKLGLMGGIVEEFVEGANKQSPSVQFRVAPDRQLEVISTHDQVLGGQNAQIFLGCRFPADAAYRSDIQEKGLAAARVLASKGVIGRFGIDFLSVPENGTWRNYALEINLRKGGTTHPFLMLQFLTEGKYDSASGLFLTRSGQPRCYYATDNLESASYRGLTPHDLINIAADNGLHFNVATQEGVTFHLIGALSEFGKLGMVTIGETPKRADALRQEVIEILNREASALAG